MAPRHSTNFGTRAFVIRTIAAQLHLFGLLAATIGLIVLLQFARQRPGAIHFWACFIFGITSILVFTASTVCHFMSDGFKISEKLERRLEDIDQAMIFLFIAGTYTPVIINVIAKPWDQILLWLVWAIGFSGIAYTYIRPRLPHWARHRFFSTGIFVLMGWVLVLRLSEAFDRLNFQEALLLVLGGASYTVGAVIYALKKPNPLPELFGYHEIWHSMVLLGFAFHYFMILDFYS